VLWTMPQQPLYASAFGSSALRYLSHARRVIGSIQLHDHRTRVCIPASVRAHSLHTEKSALDFQTDAGPSLVLCRCDLNTPHELLRREFKHFVLRNYAAQLSWRSPPRSDARPNAGGEWCNT
jgi:hypothetical protein